MSKRIFKKIEYCIDSMVLSLFSIVFNRIIEKLERHANRIGMTVVLLYVSAMTAFAQGNGVGGITQAENMIRSYFAPATKLVYAIGAVVGLIGAVKVYSKFSNGDPDTNKTAASWFGACIFLIVAATVLSSFFS